MLGLLAGCASKQASVDDQKKGDDQINEVVKNEEKVYDAIDEFNKFSAENPIYFAFDSDKVNKKDILNNYKVYFEKLKELKQVKLTINGYCDSRGSVEYNMNLGKRRASSVKNAIKNNVKNDVKMKLISFGKNKFKKYTDDVEENYRKNRRVEIIASK